MKANRPRGRGKKPLFWMIVVIAALLAGAFALYFGHLRTHSPQVSTPVVARGKIPPLPPSPSVGSPAESSKPIESAPAIEAGNAENASGHRSQSDLESSPAAPANAGPQESAPETTSEIAAQPHEDTVGSSDDESTGLGSNGAAPAKIAPPPSDLPVMNVEPTPTALSSNKPKTEASYSIQVGAFRAKNNADRQVAQLREKGFDAYLYEKNNKEQRTWYFVRFGHFENFGSADKALTAFREQAQMDGAIVRSNSN
jgi:cell division protein FtsN